MRWTIFAAIAFLAVVLQTTFFRIVEISGFEGRPVICDLLLILGLFVALNAKPFEAAVAGWFLGFATDLYSTAGPLGLAAVVFAASCAMLCYLRGEVLKNRILSQFLIAFVMTFVVHLLRYLLLYLIGESSAGLWMAAKMSLLDGLYTAIPAPYIFWLLGKLRGSLRLSVTAHP